MPSFIDINPKQLLEDLKYNVIEVLFENNDGTQRTMRCTLVKNYFPETRDPTKIQQFHEANKNALTGNDPYIEVVTAWDIDAHGWRSFRTDRIISAQMLNVN